MDVCDETVATSDSRDAGPKYLSHSNISGARNREIAVSVSATTSSQIPQSALHGCDNSSSVTIGDRMSPQTSAAVIDSDIISDQLPRPRHISEQEILVLQVCFG